MNYFKDNSQSRGKISTFWRTIFGLSTIVGIIMLIVLIINIINGAFGYVALQNTIEPQTIVASGNLEDLSKGELIQILEDNLSRGLIRRYNSEKPLVDRSQKDLIGLVVERVIELRVMKSWNLMESVFSRDTIEDFTALEYPEAYLEFRVWLTPDFLTTPQASVPEFAGIRTAIFGSLWIIIITVLFSFPVGVAAAIYLEEYAADNRINRFIQVNIYNLSGVPSIIYGLLGLAVFVRGMEFLTQGRTILSAGLTLGLLILPIIIINAQEAIRAVSGSLRQASFGLGATKWQTIWHHVLPASMDRILTGTILAVSRAIGETAPLVVIGASTFISVDPKSVFSKFTTLPIQIYQWTARPQAEFRNIAAAAIIVLLILLLSMNAVAIISRNKISQKRRAG